MIPFSLLVLGCLSYVALLFAVAFVAERRAAEGRARWLRTSSPSIRWPAPTG